jgi:hypothetical protein
VQLALFGPSGNALSQGFEPNFPAVILNISHIWPFQYRFLLFEYYLISTSRYNHYPWCRTIRQGMDRIGLPAFAFPGVRYDHQRGRPGQVKGENNAKT